MIKSKQKNQRKKIAGKPLTEILSKKSFLNESQISYIGLAILLILVVIIRLNFLTIPFERDEGAYSYYGKLLLEGKIPYKDFYEQKFPGIFYFYATFVLLFGETVRGMHTGFLLLNLATISLLYFIVKKIFSPLSGLITATSFAILSLTPYLSGFTIQSEHGVVFFASLGIFFYAYYLQNRRWYFQFLMGLAIGCAFMVKTSGLFFVAWGGLILIIQFFFLKEKTIKLFIREIIFYSLGVISIVSLLFLIIYIQGAFTDMIFWTFVIPKHYVNVMTFSDGIKHFISTRDAIFQDYSFYWYHGLLGIVVCFLKTIHCREKLFCITLILFSSFTIMPGYYFYGHYWIQLLPGVSILAGVTFFAITSTISKRLNIKSLVLQYIYLSVFLFFTFYHVLKMSSYYFNPDYDKILSTVYKGNPFSESMEIANYINTNSKPTDQIVVIGSEPEIYFYTQKECPSRHAYFSALVDDIPEHKQWQREFAADVEKAKPRYFVVFNNNVSLLVQPNTDKFIFEWAEKYITNNYKLVGLYDILPNKFSSLKVGKQLDNYKPQSNDIIYIWEKINFQDNHADQNTVVNPNNNDAYNKSGLSKYNTQDYRGAIDDFTKAIKNNPNNSEAYNNRGLSKYNIQDYRGAIADFTKATEISPNYFNPYFNIGIILVEFKNYNQAITIFSKCIQLEPEDVETNQYLGLCYKNLNQPGKSKLWLDKARSYSSTK